MRLALSLRFSFDSCTVQRAHKVWSTDILTQLSWEVLITVVTGKSIKDRLHLVRAQEYLEEDLFQNVRRWISTTMPRRTRQGSRACCLCVVKPDPVLGFAFHQALKLLRLMRWPVLDPVFVRTVALPFVRARSLDASLRDTIAAAAAYWDLDRDARSALAQIGAGAGAGAAGAAGVEAGFNPAAWAIRYTPADWRDRVAVFFGGKGRHQFGARARVPFYLNQQGPFKHSPLASPSIWTGG